MDERTLRKLAAIALLRYFPEEQEQGRIMIALLDVLTAAEQLDRIMSRGPSKNAEEWVDERSTVGALLEAIAKARELIPKVET